jgi:hypothetical protein
MSMNHEKLYCSNERKVRHLSKFQVIAIRARLTTIE